MRHPCQVFDWLLQYASYVATTSSENHEKSWNETKDYDNPRAICFNTPILDHLFAASPQLNHVFDSGNYLYCGEEVMVALRHFRERVSHVHLKDRKAMHDSESLVVGTGIVPLKDVIAELLSSGYDGWFCIEHFGAPNMLKYAAESIANVKAVLDEFKQ